MVTGDESISVTARGTQLLLTVGAIVLLAILGACGFEAPATSPGLAETAAATPAPPATAPEPAEPVAQALDSPTTSVEFVEAVEPAPDPPTLEEIHERLGAWETGLVRDYRIVYQKIGSHSQVQSEPVIITVRSGSVTSVAYEASGQAAPEGSYPTVEQLFAAVAHALSGQYRVVLVSFDPELGYPTSVSLASSWPGDAEAGFTAKVYADSLWGQGDTYGASPEALAAIEALHWVRDGLTSNERSVASELRRLAGASEPAFEDLMAKRWMVEGGDDPHHTEPLVIRALVDIALKDGELAERLVLMPFLDTIQSRDWYLLDSFSELLDMDPAGVAQVLSLPALKDGITDDLVAEVSLQYLALREPDAAEAVRTLPWVQNGLISEAPGGLDWEVQAVWGLQFLAISAPEAFRSLLDRSWMQAARGLAEERAKVISNIKTIAKMDRGSAGHVSDLPFLASLETEDLLTLGTLLRLFAADPEGARRVLSDQAFAGGTSANPLGTLALQYLLDRDPAVSAVVQSLPWVRDGIAPFRDTRVSSIHPSKASLESEVVLAFLGIFLDEREAALSLFQSSWVYDGLDVREFTALARLEALARRGRAAQVAEMPFLRTFEIDDLIALEVLEELARNNSTGLRQLLSAPEFSGGITDDQTVTVALVHLKLRDPDAAATIEALSWVADRLSREERKPVLALRELALESKNLFESLAIKPWVLDGLSRDEVTIVRNLTPIAGKSYGDKSNEALALRIIDMPFLETIDGIDAAAVTSLRSLQLSSDQPYLEQVLDHPTLSGGITDDHTVVVAALQEVIDYRPELLGTLLDPAQVNVEERVIHLPLSGEMDLSVIHLNPGSYGTMDILEQMTRSHETFMGVPYPTSYLEVVVVDATPHLGGGGPQGIIIIDPGHEEDAYLIAHELAHSYWNFAPTWLREGAAEFMTTVSGDQAFPNNACGAAENLSALQQLRLERLESGLPTDPRLSVCNYSLGRSLYIELYDTLGDSAFREGFQRLYLAMRDGKYDGQCNGEERGLCYVRAAFVTDAQQESAALAEPVIDRWYYGLH